MAMIVTTRALGPLRVRVAVVPGTPARDAEPPTVVLLHGFGAPGDDLAGLAGPLADAGAPVGTRFVFPEAPLSLSEVAGLAMYGDARAWWMVDFEARERLLRSGGLCAVLEHEPDGMEDARASLEGMLDALSAEGSSPSRTVLGGFSQGAMLSADVAFRTARPLAGLVLLSGALVAAPSWRRGMAVRAGLAAFQSHGRFDDVLPIILARPLRDAMTDAGLAVAYTEFDGPHGIPAEVVVTLGAWLRAR